MFILTILMADMLGRQQYWLTLLVYCIFAGFKHCFIANMERIDADETSSSGKEKEKIAWIR